MKTEKDQTKLLKTGGVISISNLRMIYLFQVCIEPRVSESWASTNVSKHGSVKAYPCSNQVLDQAD